MNFRSTELLERCLAALRQSSLTGDLEVIVVDNASPDFDASKLGRSFPDVAFLPQLVNTTFTGGTNLAFAASSGRYVLLLNPDTQVEPDAIAAAVELLQHPEIAAVGAYLVNPDGTPQHYYRRLPKPMDIPVVLFPSLFQRVGLGRRYLMRDLDIGPQTAVDQPPGSFLLMRRADLDGQLLDSRYGNFVSDVELCRRLRRLGQIVVPSRVRCRHVRGGAGVRTRDVAEQLRLFQDLTWGIRLYCEQWSVSARLYVELWITIFWAARLLQYAFTRPTRFGMAFAVAREGLMGLPPRYD